MRLWPCFLGSSFIPLSLSILLSLPLPPLSFLSSLPSFFSSSHLLPPLPRHSGATGDSLKSEEETLRQVEQELARTVHRMFRRPRGISLHQLNQIFSPRVMKPATVTADEKGMERRGSMRRRFTTVVRRQLFSLPSKLN